MELALLEARAQFDQGATPFHEWTLPDGTLCTQFFRDAEGYLLRFPSLADFHVSADAQSIWCRPVPGVSEETARHIYLNQVVPLAMSRKGELVLHASAVEFEHGAVAFVGASGRGKSTLAASFAAGGSPFLTDDRLHVCRDHERAAFVVHPGHPSVRLKEDSQLAVNAPMDQVPASAHQFSKVRFGAGEFLAFCDTPRKLLKMYLLADPAGAIEITPLTEADALMAWTRHSFLIDIEDRKLLAMHFERAADLSKGVRAYELRYPRRYEVLASVRDAIRAHASAD